MNIAQKEKKTALRVVLGKATLNDLKQLDAEKDNFYMEFSSNVAKTFPGATVFVAKEPYNSITKKGSGKILGYVICGFLGSPGETRVGQIVNVSVRRGYKGRKIGSKLVGKANGFFLKTGIKKAILTSKNAAQLFYKNHSNYYQRDHTGLQMETRLSRRPAKPKQRRMLLKV
jgi:ribosomal protein S18 acetylase RimI-like enzyme